MLVTSLVLLPFGWGITHLSPFLLIHLFTVRYFGKAYATGGIFAADLPANLRPAFGSVGAAGVLSPKTAILLGMLSTSYMVRTVQ